MEFQNLIPLAFVYLSYRFKLLLRSAIFTTAAWTGEYVRNSTNVPTIGVGINVYINSLK